MDELEMIFSDLSVEEMSQALENIDEAEDAELSQRIKQRVFREIAPAAAVKKKSSLKSLKYLPMAAAFVAVVIGAVIAVNELSVPSYEDTTTTAAETTQKSSFSMSGENNPLMLAISSGNEGLVSTLIKNSAFITKDVLSFAIDCVDFLSYGIIRDIAQALYDKLGTTGLDALVESTLLGDSERALAELEKREKLLMTPSEKLAYYFSVAFCDSEVIEKFFDGGYSETEKDSAGDTPVEIAKKYGNEENFSIAAGKQK